MSKRAHSEITSQQLNKTSVNLLLTTIKNAGNKYQHEYEFIPELLSGKYDNVLPNLKYLCENFLDKKHKDILRNKIILPDNSIENCVRNKYYDCFKYLMSKDYYIKDTILNSCIKIGNLTFIKSLHEEYKFKFNQASVKCAVISNDIDIVKYVQEKCSSFEQDTSCFDIAIINKNLDIIKYLIIDCKYDTKYLDMERIINNKLTDIFRFAIENNIKVEFKIIYSIYMHKEIGSLKFMLNNNYLECLNFKFIDLLLEFNDSFLFQQKYLPSQIEWKNNSMDIIIKNGNSSLLSIAVKNGCPWANDSFRKIIKKNNIDLLLISLENGVRFQLDLLLQYCELYGRIYDDQHYDIPFDIKQVIKFALNYVNQTNNINILNNYQNLKDINRKINAGYNF